MPINVTPKSEQIKVTMESDGIVVPMTNLWHYTVTIVVLM